ncbi:MAG: TatD family hydrolase [Nanoarchaeota archaeon]
MRLIDVHCHLDEFFYKEDIEDVIKRCRQNNVVAIAAGVDSETNRHVLKLREKYPDVVFASLGIYPPDALKKELEESENNLKLDYDIDKEIAFIEKNQDNIIAVGEVGMDFKDGKDFDMQEKVFRKMIELAIRINKPLVIHSRKAEKEVIDILEEYNYRKIVMHCFGGEHPQVKRIRENNWYFSIPTSIVRDEHFQKIVKETQLRQLLTETDSPFLSPFREKKNEPSNVIETIKKIAELKKLPEIDVATLMNRNANVLFFSGK